RSATSDLRLRVDPQVASLRTSPSRVEPTASLALPVASAARLANLARSRARFAVLGETGAQKRGRSAETGTQLESVTICVPVSVRAGVEPGSEGPSALEPRDGDGTSHHAAGAVLGTAGQYRDGAPVHPVVAGGGLAVAPHGRGAY